MAYYFYTDSFNYILRFITLEKMNNLYGEEKKNCSELEEFDFLYYANWIESIWCIVISITGTTGNLLTLCAIPFAARNKLYVKSVTNVHLQLGKFD